MSTTQNLVRSIAILAVVCVSLPSCASESTQTDPDDGVEADEIMSAPQTQYVSETRKVCKDTTVHQVDTGTYLGKLFPPQSIHVEKYTEYWAHGFAYGNVNKYGRVLRANLCPK